MVQGELPTIDTGGKISSPNVWSRTGGTKSKSKTVQDHRTFTHESICRAWNQSPTGNAFLDL